jgi:Fe-Mn family superoxide dismutase
MYNFIKWTTLNEGSTPKTLELLPLTYKRYDLDPSLSADTLDYHYGKLAKGYVTRFNNGEGDADFNEAGAFLHNILFAQYKEPARSNDPAGSASEFIDKHFKTFTKFKEEFLKVAMGIQGSGWVYLARNGDIKTIENHEIRMDIILLVDWWEHSYVLDYRADKKSYLENQWKIMNWNVISAKVGLVS